MEKIKKWLKPCTQYSTLRENIISEWLNPTSSIYFSGVSKVYDYFTLQIPVTKNQIRYILSPINTYSRFKEHKSPRIFNPYYS